MIDSRSTTGSRRERTTTRVNTNAINLCLHIAERLSSYAILRQLAYPRLIRLIRPQLWPVK